MTFKIIAGLLLSACLASCTQGQDNEGPDELATSAIPSTSQLGSDFSATDTMLTKACATDVFSGIVTIVTPTDMIYSFACNGGATDDPTITSDTNFKLFSTSKQITATVIMQLIESGDLSLETSVSDFFAEAPQSWNDVTVRDLLIHSSGIPDLTLGLLQQYQSGVVQHTDAVELAISTAETSPDTSSTGSWTYNNFGYEMLAVIAAKTSGQPFDALVRMRVFEPAGMVHANMEQLDTKAGDMVAVPDDGLIQGYNGTAGARTETLSYSFVQQGAGAVHASASDMVNYYRALLDGRLLSDDSRALRRAQTLTVSDATTVIPGWFITQTRDLETLSHSGGSNGYISWFGIIPERDVAIIMLSNYGDAPTRNIREVLFDDLLGPVSPVEVDAHNGAHND